jgi:hypothetical protein
VVGEKGSIKVGRDHLELIEYSSQGSVTSNPAFNADVEVEPIVFELTGFLESVRGKDKDVNSPREALSDLALLESMLLSGGIAVYLLI